MVFGSRPVRRADESPAAFWAQVDQSAGPDGCWPWTGRRHVDGYGLIYVPSIGRSIPAHRWGYMSIVGELTRLQFVCHHCDNRPCCNPAHLYVGDWKTNARDRVARGRSLKKNREAIA